MAQPPTSSKAGSPRTDPGRVFVVYGRNRHVRDAMFDFLRSLGLKPTEWDEAVLRTGMGTPYIGEVLDKAFDEAQAIVVILTGDDEARLLPVYQQRNDPVHEKKLTPQARLNVVFEAGMAFGRNPRQTILVQIGKMRPFSDVAGRHVIHFNGSSQDRQRLKGRLEKAGCQIADHGIDWLRAGDFKVAISQKPRRTNVKTPRYDQLAANETNRRVTIFRERRAAAAARKKEKSAQEQPPDIKDGGDGAT